MPMTVSSELVTFRGGFVAKMALVSRLIDIEARGARFHLEAAGRFRVEPASVLTPEDSQYLRAHRDHARQVLEDVERIVRQPV